MREKRTTSTPFALIDRMSRSLSLEAPLSSACGEALLGVRVASPCLGMRIV